VTVYRTIQRFLRFVTGVFFRNVEVVGSENIAEEGQRAVMFCGNHWNSLIDPVLIITTSGRIVRFAAKDVLFRNAVLRFFLDGLGAVPVARRMDHGGGSQDNKGAMDALANVLAAGGAMGIFPEGVAHDDSQLQKLKTGAARIALDVAHRKDQAVDVVPIGLCYLTPQRFRSSVLVQYGPPIEVGSEFVDQFLHDEKATVRDLTAKIEAGLRALTVNAPDWDTVRVLDAVRRLYQPPGLPLWQRVELSRRFNEVYPSVKERPEVVALVARVRAWLDRLHDVGLSDRDLRRAPEKRAVVARVVAHLGLMLVWTPLAVPGVVLHLPLALLISWLAPLVTPRKDVIATTKLVLGLVLTALVYGGLVAAMFLHAGLAIAVAVATALPLTGYATMRAMERGMAIFHQLHTLAKLLTLDAEIESLRKERSALQDLVWEAVERLRPAGMEPLVVRPPA
jgi:glycerol-3-phosphate O-acyltransferase/dihydroxyacetone phosphate acyltransferase